MAGKVKVLPTSRVGVAPLAEMAQQLCALVPGWEDALPAPDRPRQNPVFLQDLEHLAHHDTDGVLVASQDQEVVGLVASFVRSRSLLISHLWVQPESLDQEVHKMLMRKALQFGERTGTQRVVFHALAPWQVALGLQFSLSPVFPLLRLRLTGEQAAFLAHNLVPMLPGTEVTTEAVSRRAFFADLERLDRLVRGFSRPMDHEYWLFSRNLRLAVVREGERITAYAYGGPGQCGPVVGATEESTLAALGWALRFGEGTPPSAPGHHNRRLELLLPASFTKGCEHVLETKPEVVATTHWMASEHPRLCYFLPASLSLL